jgi:asparagine synthase (glutamine-hydrolysing)
VAPEAWDRGFERFGAVLPGWLRHRMPGYKIHKLAGSLRARSPFDLYRHLTSYWADPAHVVIGGREPAEGGAALPRLTDITSQMVLMDQLGYLPNDGLVKVERASRAVGLDVRVPLLDHRIVEFGWRLPLDFKLREGTSKWVLRQVLHRYVPRELIERPKTGFGIPLGAWLRGPLREWAEALLDERRLREDGYFNPEPIRKLWAQHLAGTHRWEYQLWAVLMFNAWLDQLTLPRSPEAG